MESLGTTPQRSPEASRPAASPTAAAAPAPALPAKLTDAEQSLVKNIEVRHAALGNADHFVVLGVPNNAVKEEVKGAYLRLAKTFHPDRLPPTLGAIAPKGAAVFESIRIAYETLFDDTKRVAYINSQKPAVVAPPAAKAPAKPALSQEASDLMKLAETAFKKRDYRTADQHYAKAYLLSKSADALAAQAWAIYMDPSRKPEGPQARAMMNQALTIDPNCDRANYQLGVIARVENDLDKAEKYFRETVRANPRHLEAAQEIRLIDLRKRKAAEAPPPKKGFFG